MGITSWNMRGYSWLKVDILLNNLENIQCFCLQETWGLAINDDYEYMDYRFFVNNRKGLSTKGGMAIMIKNDIRIFDTLNFDFF